MTLNGPDTLASPVRIPAPTFCTVKVRFLLLPTPSGAKSRVRRETAIAGLARSVPAAAASQTPVNCVATRIPQILFFIAWRLWLSNVLTNKHSHPSFSAKINNSAHYGGESVEAGTVGREKIWGRGVVAHNALGEVASAECNSAIQRNAARRNQSSWESVSSRTCQEPNCRLPGNSIHQHCVKIIWTKMMAWNKRKNR